MASSGPNNPATAADDNTVGTLTWANTPDVLSSNNVRSYCGTGLASANTHYMKVTNFGFSIPATATIDGVEVTIEGYVNIISGASGNIYSVKLVKGGTIQGNDNSSGQNFSGVGDNTVTLGSSSDLWGLTLTYSDINSTDFGAVVALRLINGKITVFGYLDNIRITVYYTEGGASSAISSVGNVSYANASKVSNVNKANISKIINIT